MRKIARNFVRREAAGERSEHSLAALNMTSTEHFRALCENDGYLLATDGSSEGETRDKTAKT